ncbi:MAG: dicarboxylate/amino acid:cation symporter [Candidatus Paceibacterota bacterium]
MTHPIELLHPRNLKYLTTHLQGLIKNRLWLQILIGMFTGFLVGLLFSPTVGFVGKETADTLGEWLALPGRFFLVMIQMIVVPLIFASIIRGIAANENMQQLKSIGLKLVVYFLLTTAIAVSIGVGLATLVKPGHFIETPPLVNEVSTAQVRGEIVGDPISLNSIPDSIISILPDNPLYAAVEVNMLQIVLFSVVVGLALVNLQPRKSQPLLELLGSLQSVAMTVVRWMMYIAPLAVFGLIAQLVIHTGIESFFGIGVYILTVFAGLLLMLVVYLLIVFFVGGWLPLTFLRNIREVVLLAFSTGSSAAVMPLSIKTVEEKFKVRSSVSQFVIPIGATVNMDATALFQGIATIFLIQAYGIELSFGLLMVLIFTIIGSSIGAPATPGVGIIILSVVLKGVGVPLEGLALIIGVDRILEMMRTSINVTGDLVASIVMDRIGRVAKSLEEEEEREIHHEKRRHEERRDVIVEEVPVGISV